MSISEKIKRSMVTITEERYRFQVAEIERLREALQLIANPLRGPDVTHYLVVAGYQDIARKALEGK